MKKLVFAITLSFSFLFLFSLRPLFAIESYPSSPYSQQGEVLGANEIKDLFLTFKGFLSGEQNLFQWVIGKTLGEEFQNHGFLGAIIFGILTQILGIPEEAVGDPQSSIPPGAIVMPPGDWYFSGGVVGGVNNMIASVISVPPASGVYYAYDVINNFGFVPVYAANRIGFSGLAPVLNVWKIFRNAVYILFSLIFVITGLMIMFRAKIAPQTVLTVENALPRLISVLLLVTFSYAIAGFLIDLMYVFLGFFLQLMSTSGMKVSLFGVEPTFNTWLNWGPLTLLPPYLVTSFLGGFLGATFGALGGVVVGSVLPGVGKIAGALGGGSAGALLFIAIFAIIFLVQFFKILIKLIQTYFSILVLIITAPIQLVAGVLPGSALGFGFWIRNLIANLLVFPAVIIVLMIGYYLMSNIEFGTSRLWLPPLLNFNPLNINFEIISLTKGIIGFGIILLLPKIPDIVKSAMGARGIGGLAATKEAFTPVIVGGRAAGSYYAARLEEQRNLQMKTPRYEVRRGTSVGYGIANALRTAGLIK